MQAAKDLQNDMGNFGLQEVKTSRSGVWQSQVCVNATTKLFHIEHVCSYTPITVPKQSMKIKPIIVQFHFMVQQNTIF